MPRRRTTPTAALAATALAAALAGCGSSSSSTSATTAPPAGSATTTSTPATSPTTAGPASPTTVGFTVGDAPAVTGATDLTKEPTIAAGTPPPPTVPTGKDLVPGTGPAATASSTVKVQYVGALYDTGKVFDASWTDSGPTSFSLDQVIAGFKDAIVGMKVGGRREIVIPPAEGYGAAGSPPVIPGNATLVFVIDLLGVS